ncbi:MAG TPA: energy transducer TonB [Edaphobacter sp.]|nr:energy transducer TonB [Edaphobacter sp.]
MQAILSRLSVAGLPIRAISVFYLLIHNRLRRGLKSLDLARNPCKSGVHHTQMPFFLDTQETVQRFGNSIAEFRSLLDTNHIRHGSPDDLFEFARRLESSNQFRLDLSALVKSVVKKEKEEILLTDMMSIIAASVGGQSVAETDADITKPTNALMEFLLGTGCWKQFGLSSRPVSQARTVAQGEAEPLRPAVRSEEPHPIPISPPVPTASITGENSEDRSNLLDLSHELRQTLTRLESNTQQVKLHLDSIEQRINKIELPPDVQPTRTSSGLEPLLHRGTVGTVTDRVAQPLMAQAPMAQSPIAQPLDEGIPTFGAKFSASNRAVFSHPAEPQIEDDDFSSPTFAYGTEKRRSILPIGVFLVLAAIFVAAFFFFFRSGKGEALLASGRSRLETARAHLSSAPATTPGGAAATSPPPAASVPAASVPAAPAAEAAAGSGITGTTPVNSATSDSASSNRPPDAQPASGNPEVKYIQSQVMEGHLISAPRPEYPPQARKDHIEGQVALQATISRSGSIQTLHVIKGPAALRGAAIDAVRSWRYRPYSEDGQAIKVATTIYVDFSLRPPPALVH